MTIRAAADGNRYNFPVTLEVDTCDGCGVVFAVPDGLMRKWREGKRRLRCINPGCKWPSYIPGTSLRQTNLRLTREKERLARRLEFERNSKAAIKGHLTRTKKRIAAGVCPCCKRTFQDLARHMNGQHPDYAPPKEGK